MDSPSTRYATRFSFPDILPGELESAGCRDLGRQETRERILLPELFQERSLICTRGSPSYEMFCSALPPFVSSHTSAGLEILLLTYLMLLSDVEKFRGTLWKRSRG